MKKTDNKSETDTAVATVNKGTQAIMSAFTAPTPDFDPTASIESLVDAGAKIERVLPMNPGDRVIAWYLGTLAEAVTVNNPQHNADNPSAPKKVKVSAIRFRLYDTDPAKSGRGVIRLLATSQLEQWAGTAKVGQMVRIERDASKSTTRGGRVANNYTIADLPNVWEGIPQ